MADQTIGTATLEVDGTDAPYSDMVDGDTLYITGEGSGSPRDHLVLENFSTATIWVVNAGDVYIDGSDNARFACITFKNCDGMHLAGIGTGTEFGFNLSGATNTCVRIYDCSENIEVEHVECNGLWEENGDATVQGISCVTKTNDSHYAPGFEIDNISIHDCYIHNYSEGMYLGKISGGAGVPLNNLTVQHCYLYWGAVDAIGLQQVITATIRDVRMDQCGLDPPEGQAGAGFVVFDECEDVEVSRCWITNAVEGVYASSHDGSLDILYNLIETMGDEGIQIATTGKGDSIEWNTVLTCAGDGIKTKAGDVGANTLRNNIAAGITGTAINSDWGTVSNNETGSVGDQNFRASDPLRHLTVTSPALAAAHDGSDCGWKERND